MSILSLTQICVDIVVQKPELYGQAMKKFPESSQERINQICLERRNAALLSPSQQELKKRLFLVHATNVFPKDKTLKPGAYVVLIKEGRSIFETYRHTVHFAIGGLVQPHTSGLGDEYSYSWENQKFAFVTSLKKRQLIHLFPADSFALGAYKLESKTICITDKENAEAAKSAGWPKEKIVTRKKKTPVRRAIDQYIKEHNGWLIHTKPGQSGLGMHARFKEGPYRFFDLAQPYFYTSFLALNQSFLFFGPASDSGYGGLFKQFDLQLFRKASICYHHSNRILIVDIFEKEEIQFYLKLVPKLLECNEFTGFVKAHLTAEDYNEWLTWIYYSLQFMQLDLTLRKEGYYLALDFEADYPDELLQFRESLFEETQKTQDKGVLIQEAQIVDKYEQLKKVIDSCKPTLRPVNKVKIFHFFAENAQLEVLRNFSWEHFQLYLPNMIPIDKGEKGTQNSLMLCTQLCYCVDKYLLTQEEHYLGKIHESIKAIQQELSLEKSTREVFHFMAQNHPRLNFFLLNLLTKIDRESSLYQTAQKFKKYFGISRPLFDDLLENSRLTNQKPNWEIADMEKKLEEVFAEKDPIIQEELLNIWFTELESNLEGLQWAGIEIDEHLTTWRLSYPIEWDSLLQWLLRIPQEHPKVQEWNYHLKNAEKWHQKNLDQEKRFFEALSESNPLKLI